MQIINLNEVFGLDKIRKEINSYDLDSVTFLLDGKEVTIDKQAIKNTGLNNFDFCLMTEFKNG